MFGIIRKLEKIIEFFYWFIDFDYVNYIWEIVEISYMFIIVKLIVESVFKWIESFGVYWILKGVIKWILYLWIK